MTAELTSYIEKAREKKLSDEHITNSLLAAGWPADQVAAALAGNSDLPVPPPPSVGRVDMWTGFMYILFFISLYVLATSVAGIFHIWVDKVTPLSSQADNYGSLSSIGSSPLDWIGSSFWAFDIASLVRGYMSAIFVSYPIFVFLAYMIKRQMVKNPMVKNLRSRKILIYFTLIMTFLILLTEVITTGYNFLAGSFTQNAIRHVLVTFIIAGTIFAYFISEVKNDRHIS